LNIISAAKKANKIFGAEAELSELRTIEPKDPYVVRVRTCILVYLSKDKGWQEVRGKNWLEVFKKAKVKKIA
jgi:hypothetical protein